MSSCPNQHSLLLGVPVIPPDDLSTEPASLEHLTALAAQEPSKIKRVLSFYILAKEQRRRDRENAQKARSPGFVPGE